MKFMSREECVDWRRQKSLPELEHGFTYLNGLPTCRFAFPNGRGSEAWLAGYLALVLPTNGERLLEVSEWGIWQSSENWHLVDRLRLSYGETAKLWEKPGHLTAADETDDLATFIHLAMLSGWDAVLQTDNDQAIVYISHDEWLAVRADDAGLVEVTGGELSNTLNRLPS